MSILLSVPREKKYKKRYRGPEISEKREQHVGETVIYRQWKNSENAPNVQILDFKALRFAVVVYLRYLCGYPLTNLISSYHNLCRE